MIPGVPYQIIITDRNSHNAKERRKENTIGKVLEMENLKIGEVDCYPAYQSKDLMG